MITLPEADEIMSAQGGEAVEGYTLENIELEYESIDNIELARKAENLYGSERNLSFEHATLMKKTEWSKDSTIINETINVPRRSMKAIVMLFTNKTKTDSEEYVYPNIEKVRVLWKVFLMQFIAKVSLKQGYMKRQGDCLVLTKSVIRH